jgi:hypothetical protein
MREVEPRTAARGFFFALRRFDDAVGRAHGAYRDIDLFRDNLLIALIESLTWLEMLFDHPNAFVRRLCAICGRLIDLSRDSSYRRHFAVEADARCYICAGSGPESPRRRAWLLTPIRPVVRCVRCAGESGARSVVPRPGLGIRAIPGVGIRAFPGPARLIFIRHGLLGSP